MRELCTIWKYKMRYKATATKMASSCCLVFFLFLNSLSKNKRCSGNHACVTIKKHSEGSQEHLQPYYRDRENITLQLPHSICWINWIWGLWIIKRSHVNYNPQFTWQLRREIHFHLFFPLNSNFSSAWSCLRALLELDLTADIIEEWKRGKKKEEDWRSHSLTDNR